MSPLGRRRSRRRFVRPAGGQQTASAGPSDLEPYIWQRRVISDVAPAADTLRDELVAQVERIVEAGHLLPYYVKRGELNPRWYFTNPGDLVGTLAHAYPYLPTELRSRVRQYLADEMAEYPPWTDRLNAPSAAGTPRQHFRVPEHLWEWHDGRPYAALPRIHNVYSIWAYVDHTSDRSLLDAHWREIVSFYQQHQRNAKAYLGGVAAPIGLARLAHLDRRSRDGTSGAARRGGCAASDRARALLASPCCGVTDFRNLGQRSSFSQAFSCCI